MKEQLLFLSTRLNAAPQSCAQTIEGRKGQTTDMSDKVEAVINLSYMVMAA